MNTSLAFQVLMCHQLLNIYLYKESKNMIKNYFFLLLQAVTDRIGDVRGIYKDIQWLKVGDRRVQGVTGVYSSKQGMCTGADKGVHRGWQGKHRGCQETQGIFIRTGVFRANSESSILLRYNFPKIFRLQIHYTLKRLVPLIISFNIAQHDVSNVYRKWKRGVQKANNLQ